MEQLVSSRIHNSSIRMSANHSFNDEGAALLPNLHHNVNLVYTKIMENQLS